MELLLSSIVRISQSTGDSDPWLGSCPDDVFKLKAAVFPAQRVARSHLRTALSDQSGRVGPNSVKAGASLLLPAAPSHRGFRRETRSPEDGDVT